MTVTLSLLPINRSTLQLRIHSEKDDAKLAREMERFTYAALAATHRSELVH